MRFGTSGIPSCISGDIVRGVKGVADLGLSAMEILFIDDLKMKAPIAFEIGKVARETGVKLSISTPSSVDLLRSKKVGGENQKKILDIARFAGIMKASPVVIKPGSGKNTSKVVKALEPIIEGIREESIETKIGLETSARQKDWGSLSDVLKVCSKLDVVPVLNFANLYARSKEKLTTKKAYLDVFEKVMKVNPNLLFDLHIHFSNIQRRRGKPYKYTSIGSSPPFEPLAEVLIKLEIEPTLISETPSPEVGAVKMREIISKMRS